MSTVSTKPYLIRALYEWCVDQGFTPYLAAQVGPEMRIPPGSARDGQIVLNISADATHQLSIDNEWISFQARFGGVAHAILIPVARVMAIYARENGQGMAFEVDAGEAQAAPAAAAPADSETAATPARDDDGPRPAAPRSGAHLKRIK